MELGITKAPGDFSRGFSFYAPTHDVAPRAVRIAVAIDAINCTRNLAVSFLLIKYLLSCFKQGLQNLGSSYGNKKSLSPVVRC